MSSAGGWLQFQDPGHQDMAAQGTMIRQIHLAGSQVSGEFGDSGDGFTSGIKVVCGGSGNGVQSPSPQEVLRLHVKDKDEQMKWAAVICIG